MSGPGPATQDVLSERLPGSLGRAVAGMPDGVVVADLYSEHGARAYDDTAVVERNEMRVIRQVLRRHGGPVLELAAGSGRLTVPMLQAGRPVTALELAQGMLDVLAENLAEVPPAARGLLTVVQGDMTDFDLGADFGVVVLGAGTISVLDAPGRTRLFRCVRRHLGPDGVFLFSIVTGLDDSGADTDVAVDLTGRSGRRYRLHEYRAGGAVERLVAVYPLDTPEGEPTPLFVGRHRILALDPTLQEVEQAGLAVRNVVTVESPGQRVAEVFLEVGEPT